MASGAASRPKVAFIGLGVMGYPMAGHLANTGYHVTVYNRTQKRADAWLREYPGQFAPSPADAAGEADFVFTCVGNDNDLREVALGNTGVLTGMKRGAVFCDHTTASAQMARELHQVATEKGVDFLDAPVSGGQAGAENGQLAVMIGAESALYQKVAPIIDCYAKVATLIGPVGSGQLAKMVNQICIAGVVQGLSEAINFAERAGLDLDAVLSVISQGAAQSWQMENRGKTMAENQFGFGFAVDWMRKDLGMCLEEGNRIEARLPMIALIDQFYADVQARGGGRWDTSSLIRLLSERNKP